jgi:hypothetical protein
MSTSNCRFTEHDANELFAFDPGEADDPIFFREFLSTFKQVPGKPAPAEKADRHIPFHIKGFVCTRLPTSPSDTLDAASKIACKAITTVPYGAMIRCQQDHVFGRQLSHFAWNAMRETIVVPSLPPTATRCVVCSKASTQSTKDAGISIGLLPEVALLLMVDPVYFICARAKCMAHGMQAKLMTAKEKWNLCASCDKYEAIGGPKFPECARCKLVLYCGKDCQRNHWPEHRKMCKHGAKLSATTTSKNY